MAISKSCRNGLRLIAIALLALLAPGCAGSAGQEKAEEALFEAHSLPLPPVGNVTPVFMGVQCSEACPSKFYLTRSRIFAVNQAGAPVPALSLDDAVSQAGDAVSLSQSLTNKPDAEVIAQASMQNVRTTLDLMVGIAYGVYLASNAEALQKKKMESVIIPDHAGITRGWVFFPNGNYREIKITMMQASSPGLWSSPEDTPIRELTLPWTAPAPAGSDLWVEYGITPWNLPK